MYVLISALVNSHQIDLFLEIGNEPFLPGIRLTSDNLILDGKNSEVLKFFMDSPDECQNECVAR